MNRGLKTDNSRVGVNTINTGIMIILNIAPAIAVGFSFIKNNQDKRSRFDLFINISPNYC